MLKRKETSTQLILFRKRKNEPTQTNRPRCIVPRRCHIASCFHRPFDFLQLKKTKLDQQNNINVAIAQSRTLQNLILPLLNSPNKQR